MTASAATTEAPRGRESRRGGTPSRPWRARSKPTLLLCLARNASPLWIILWRRSAPGDHRTINNKGALYWPRQALSTGLCASPGKCGRRLQPCSLADVAGQPPSGPLETCRSALTVGIYADHRAPRPPPARCFLRVAYAYLRAVVARAPPIVLNGRDVGILTKRTRRTEFR